MDFCLVALILVAVLSIASSSPVNYSDELGVNLEPTETYEYEDSDESIPENSAQTYLSPTAFENL